MMKIDVVIVTFNRIKNLKISLQAFDEQTVSPGRILIVNNASNDGTKEYLERWKEIESNYEKIVLNLDSNIGGAGGFATGIEYFVNNNSEWIWVSDDDAYPEKNAIKNAMEFLNSNKKELNNISAICGKVINNNKIDLNHRRTIKEGILTLRENASKISDYENEFFPIDSYTYVGTIMNANKIKIAGNTNKEFFIFYDDSEHAARMKKVGKILCVPSIEIIHDVMNNFDNKDEYTWKTYYLFRNRLYFYKNNFNPKYYKFEIIKLYMRILKKRNGQCTKLIISAIDDFKNGKMGLNDIYKPGWKLENKR